LPNPKAGTRLATTPAVNAVFLAEKRLEQPMSRVLFACIVLGLFTLTGCGETEQVTGTVTLDGQPLPDAEVEFTPVDGGRPAIGVTNADGVFELQYRRNEAGALTGRYNVRVSTATQKSGENGEEIDVPEKVPSRYQQDGTIVLEVLPGSNDFKIRLSTAPDTDDKADAEGLGTAVPSC